MPSSPDSRIDHVAELLCAHVVRCAPDMPTKPGSRSPERVPIGTPAVGVKPMLVSIGLAITHRRQARAVAKVREDDAAAVAASGRRGAPALHQEGVGKAVKSVAPHALRFVAARNRQQSAQRAADRGEMPCRNRRSEACREAAMKHFDQLKFFRQVLGIEQAQLAHAFDHFVRDRLRRAVIGTAVHDPVSRGNHRDAAKFVLNPVEQYIRRCCVIRQRRRARETVLPIGASTEMKTADALCDQGSPRISAEADGPLRRPRT